MGIIRRGPPVELILKLNQEFRINTFVETGTYYGETALWAASAFQQVITVESSELLFSKAQERFQPFLNIKCIQGDSRKILRSIVSELNTPAIFWLDSHWSGGETSGSTDECPLIDELNVFVESSAKHLLFIDDARLFLSPPPEPHDPEQWPAITDVIGVLRALNYQTYVVVIEDVIICVPEEYKPVVLQYCRKVNNLLWKARKEISEESNAGISKLRNYLKKKIEF